MSFTAHKIGGPKGIAGLYLKKSHLIKPLLLGGGQQFDLRSGTESYPLIAAFTEAAELSLNKMNENFTRISLLKKSIKDAIKKNIASALFNFEDTSPYILCFIIPGISSDIILRHLEVKDTYIGSTSACSSRMKGINPSLSAFLIHEKLHKNILRISLGTTSNGPGTQKFIDDFLSVWKELSFFVK